MQQPVLKVTNLVKRFHRKTILNDISLSINSGEIFGVIGLSGSGKTTLLNTIIGFLEPEAGDVHYKLEHLLSFEDDSSQFRSVFSYGQEIKTLFGFSAQTPSFYAQLTCVENLEYFGKLYRIPRNIRKTNIEILLNLMGLQEAQHLPAKLLSGGMGKRLDIACALIHDPKILILDEPTSDLDPLLRKQMWKLIKEINRKGTTIILSSHFLEELEHYCDRVGILHDAHVIISGTPAETKRYYTKEQEIELETQKRDYDRCIRKLKEKSSSLALSTHRQEGKKLVIYSANAEGVLREILHTLPKNDAIIDVKVQDPSLEEILQKLKEIHDE